MTVAAHATSEPRGAVLLVDDEPGLRYGLARVLERAGYVVDTVGDGASAAERTATIRYDVIVSDIRLPGLDGIGFLRAVRRHDLDVPVILMTGDPSVDTAARAVEYGALRYLVKPFADELLLASVVQAVQLHRLARVRRQALDPGGHPDEHLGDLASLDLWLDQALGSLTMAYQPIVSWRDRRVVAYEALLRVTHPHLPHPGAVLGAAERLDRLSEVGRAVRRNAATDLARCPGGELFVNLHPLDLDDDDLLDAAAPLSRHAHRVVLEITERTALERVADVDTRIAALRRLGYRIAIDDLGAGYSGLTSVAHLEPEIVKFDMSLVRGIDNHPTKPRLVSAMLDVFEDMGLTVIAEGVETARERDTLVGLGCDLLQGFLFARPDPTFPEPTW